MRLPFSLTLPVRAAVRDAVAVSGSLHDTALPEGFSATMYTEPPAERLYTMGYACAVSLNNSHAPVLFSAGVA